MYAVDAAYLQQEGYDVKEFFHTHHHTLHGFWMFNVGSGVDIVDPDAQKNRCLAHQRGFSALIR